jgi:large subunit ribosomal protein L29
MAKSKALNELTDTEVVEAVANAREELLNLRFQRVTGQLDNNSRIGAVKKDIARALTELRAREISAAEALQR